MESVSEMIIRQYAASLSMLREACRRCPEEVWIGLEPRFAFWQIAYHAVYYTDLYAADSVATFEAWKDHVEGAERLQLDAPRRIESSPPVTPEQTERYGRHVIATIRRRVPAQDLAGTSGVPWWDEFSKLEMHVYNIRHAQHHVGQLMDRLRNAAGIELKWVGQA